MFYLKPGDKVWYAISDYLVVPATVEECQDIYIGPDGKTRWHSRFVDGKRDYVAVATDESGETWKRRDPAVLKGLERASQLLWLDENIGHEVCLGDDCFLTLNEALKHVKPTSKRHLKRRLKIARRSFEEFVAHTWEMVGEKHPGFERVALKKVYVRRG